MYLLVVLVVLVYFLAIINCEPTDTQDVQFEIKIDSDPISMAEDGCRGKYDSCKYVAVNAIKLHKARMFNQELHGWRFNEYCNCSLPPHNEKREIIQFLHIPKTGTSLNWFLHDYFDNCTDNPSVREQPFDISDREGEEEEVGPCSRWLKTPEDQMHGLCGGRLFSCLGHRVSSDLPLLTIHAKTNFVTMMRHPWTRLSSDFHYFRKRPDSKHLGDEIDVARLLATTNTVYEHSAFPGIANCATKMLNGLPCGLDIELNDSHLETAKEVLLAAIFFGITEHFKSSVCLMAWMHGGDPNPSHFRTYRKGDYQRQSMEEALSEEQLRNFKQRERFDLELYAFALEIFRDRMQLAGCPIFKDD